MDHLIKPHGGILQNLLVDEPRATALKSQACSPDGAKRNPGIAGATGGFPRISLSLHAGYPLSLDHPAPRPRLRVLQVETLGGKQWTI
jgi:hypothetical protein